MNASIYLPYSRGAFSAAKVQRCRVTVGDTVTQGDTLYNFASGFAEIIVVAPVSGSIVELSVREGDRIDVGSTVATIDTDDTDAVKEYEGQLQKDKAVHLEQLEKNKIRQYQRVKKYSVIFLALVLVIGFLKFVVLR